MFDVVADCLIELCLKTVDAITFNSQSDLSYNITLYYEFKLCERTCSILLVDPLNEKKK